MAYTEVNPVRLDRALVAQGGLAQFVAIAWAQVDATPYVANWHIDEVCAHLEAVSRGECRRLVINVPPGTGKSLIVSVFWPVWDWLTRPDRRWIYASFDATLSQRDALRAKDLIRSRWFQARWGTPATHALRARGRAPLVVVDSKGEREIQNTATVYYTSGGGLRFSTSVGGKSTGWHSHIQVVDDPTKPYDIQSEGVAAINALRMTRDWWRTTMATRSADASDFSRVVVMQRLHEDDLSAECERDGYTVLRLPMRYVPAARCVTPWGGDRREVADELLFPARFPRAAVETIERELGPSAAAGQLQQNPTPASGNIFRPDWLLHVWTSLPAGLSYAQSWDMTFSAKAGSDFVAGHFWGAKTEILPRPATTPTPEGVRKQSVENAIVRERAFLIDRIYDRLSFVESVAAVKSMLASHPNGRKILIEDKANGPAVANVLTQEIQGVELVTPLGDKVSRANAVTMHFQAGNVFLPERAEWVPEYRRNMERFPRALNDDDVDATSQALIYFFGSPAERYKRAMANVRANG